MALRPPDAPSLHFKARDGFITAGTVDADEETESEEETEVEEEEPVEEEDEEAVEEEVEEEVEGEEEEPVEEDDEFFEEAEEEPTEEEAEPVAEAKQSMQMTQPAQSKRPTVEKSEPTVIVQPADAGGRTGSALPTQAEMAAYAQPENRGQAIIRHFEEEDRRMSEQLATQTEQESDRSSIFEFHMTPPDVGGGKWLFLIAALTILGYTVVRQLAMDPLKPSKQRREELTVGNTIKKPVVKPTVKMPPPPTETVQRTGSKPSKEELIAKALKEVRAASEQEPVKQPSSPRPTKRPPIEVKTAYAVEETKKTPRPRSIPKPENISDDSKHIEIRI